MKDHTLIQIGKKLKDIRLGKSMTMQTVANLAGVSKGLISRIENGRTVPSLPVLLSIIQGLEVSISSFFEDINYVKFDDYVLKSPEDQVYVEKDDAIGYYYNSILTYSLHSNHTTVEVFLLKVDPDAQRELKTTDGYELIYLIEGEIIYELGKEQFEMKKGDTLFFNGRIPHRKLNHSTQTATMLVVYLLDQH